MNKRILATFLWFNVGWTAGAMASYFLGLPDGLNVVLAAGLGALIWFDPRHLLWPAAPMSRVRRPDDLVAERRLPAGQDLIIE
jgi:hypothetical protein